MDLFIKFLNNIKDDSNKSLIESITDGYKVLIEGYADVVEENGVDNISKFNQYAEYNSAYLNIPALSKINRIINSSDTQQYYDINHDDDDESFGQYMTNDYYDKFNPINKKKLTFEDNLGVTPDEMIRKVR